MKIDSLPSRSYAFTACPGCLQDRVFYTVCIMYVNTYILLYVCTYRMYECMYVREPGDALVRAFQKHIIQVETHRNPQNRAPQQHSHHERCPIYLKLFLLSVKIRVLMF